MDIIFKGSDAASKSGLFYSLSHTDHPAVSLNQNPKRISVGESSVIRLVKKEEFLQFSGCVYGDPNFEAKYKIPYTKENCKMINFDKLIEVCSSLEWFGIEYEGANPLCTPKVLIDKSLKYTVGKDNCSRCCETIFYEAHSTTAILDEYSIHKAFEFYNITGVKQNETAVLEFYFETFKYSRNYINREGIKNFFANVGGWMALSVGASLITIGEIIYTLYAYSEFFIEQIKKFLCKTLKLKKDKI